MGFHSHFTHVVGPVHALAVDWTSSLVGPQVYPRCSHGLKKFKKGPFQKAAMAECSKKKPPHLLAGSANPVPASETNPSAQNVLTVGTTDESEAPEELVCPITFNLMTIDPVVAADG